MVSTDSIESELEEIAESEEVDLDELKEKFEEKKEYVAERMQNSSEERVESLALRKLKQGFLESNRIPTQEVEMLTVGGSVRNWDNGDTFVGKAIVDLEPDTDSEQTYKASVIASENDVDIGSFYDAFEDVGNVVSGSFSVSEADDDRFRVLNAAPDTEVDVMVPGEEGRMNNIGFIREEVEQVAIENIGDNMSARSRNEETGDLQPMGFGVDIKRIEADIFDGYKNPEEGFGVYTIRDETVFDDDEILESVVVDADNLNENAVPGMTCWVDPVKMDFGSNSVCEFYGVVSTDSDGIPVMNVDGIVPILAEDWDGYTASSGSESPGGEEETDVDTTDI